MVFEEIYLQQAKNTSVYMCFPVSSNNILAEEVRDGDFECCLNVGYLDVR